MDAVTVDHLSFRYAGAAEPALRDVVLEIPQAEFVLVSGASGCGKSTLALALAGFIPNRVAGTYRGGVSIEGTPLGGRPIHDIAQQVGMVFQNPDEQLIHLDVESEVAFGPENLGLSSGEIQRRVAESLAATGAAHLGRRLVHSLSGGEKQRVVIAATLAMRPRILVLDEPTSDLDPAGTRDILQLLSRLQREQGATIVLIEHKLDDVVGLADRVVLMDEGKIVLDAPPRLAFRNPAVWRHLGVEIPEVVALAQGLPDVFAGRLPLTVAEAEAKLHPAPSLVAEPPELERGWPDPSPKAGAGPVAAAWSKVSLAFDGVEVLRELDLTLHRGEWLALIGGNGSGKSSLASLAMGFLEPTGGSVVVGGRPVAPGAPARQARSVGYLFQDADTMLFGSSVEAELAFGRRRHALGDVPTVDELLDVGDLAALRQANPYHLSHGQRKRLAIAALLAFGPDMLVLDEPTTGQDEQHAREVLDFLDRLRRRRGLTYLMITHDMRAVARYATRVAVLHDGRIALSGLPEEVFAQGERLAELGLAPPPVAALHARIAPLAPRRVALSVEDLLVRLGRREWVAQ